MHAVLPDEVVVSRHTSLSGQVPPHAPCLSGPLHSFGWQEHPPAAAALQVRSGGHAPPQVRPFKPQGTGNLVAGTHTFVARNFDSGRMPN